METNHFSSLPLSPELIAVTQELGYEEMTPIQKAAIPLLLSDKDLIGQARTGSGKTAAFALPILQQINLQVLDVQALILCPTRELATQVVGEIRKLGRRHEGLRVLNLVGGQSGREQAQEIDKGAHVIVGTPGRILDHLQRERLNLEHLRTLVLDEADKMLDMGFEAEVKAVLKVLPQKRQTAFFSATFPEAILALSRKYQKNPVQVTVEATTDDTHPIEQIVYEVESENKVHALMRVLQQHPADSVIIFCNMKNSVNEIAESIRDYGVTCSALHGDLEQRDREKVMALFRNGSLPILVATDIAARGLDIENLDLVINFDLPSQTETYVHRIGRTGRAGRQGVAITIAGPRDTLKLLEFEKLSGGSFLRPALGFKNQHGLSKFSFQPKMRSLVVSGGRKDKLRAGDILGALTGPNSELKGSDIGKIEIHDSISYVAVATALADKALEVLRLGKIKGKKFQIKLIGKNP